MQSFNLFDIPNIKELLSIKTNKNSYTIEYITTDNIIITKSILFV